jgi:hypothetical protein
MWKYDPIAVEIVWFPESSIEDGRIVFGQTIGDDLSVDLGDRTNDGSTIDSGLRIIDGNF